MHEGTAAVAATGAAVAPTVADAVALAVGDAVTLAGGAQAARKAAPVPPRSASTSRRLRIRPIGASSASSSRLLAFGGRDEVDDHLDLVDDAHDTERHRRRSHPEVGELPLR